MAHVQEVKIIVSLFNKVSGRSEECNVRFNVQARPEFGRGIALVITELDSKTHTRFVHELVKNLRK